MKLRLIFCLSLLCFAIWFGPVARAQESGLVVGEIDFPENVWGRQVLPFDVTNNTPELKFLTVETDIAFEDSYIKPRRLLRSNFVVPPETSERLTPQLEIPSNYGQMTLWVRIYDVIDTLDDLALGTRVFEQPFRVRLRAPEGIVPYFQERITLPPLAGNYGLMDNEFARLLPILLSEGKSPSEIAVMAETDTAFVRDLAGRMVTLRYLQATGSGYAPVAAVIPQGFALEGRALADSLANQLADALTANFGERRRLIDSLAAAGRMKDDSTNFYQGTTVLYRPYPLTAGLCLWRELGEGFIGQGQPFRILATTDPCRPNLGPYMYLVQGGDFYNGTHLYDARIVKATLEMRFGDQIPEVECFAGFERKMRLNENTDWAYSREYAPETFLIDTGLTYPVVRALTARARDLLGPALTELGALAARHGQSAVTGGHRYWFWNLIATRTLARLIETGSLTREGNGQFKLIEKTK